VQVIHCSISLCYMHQFVPPQFGNNLVFLKFAFSLNSPDCR
jgi:hypothetical protein